MHFSKALLLVGFVIIVDAEKFLPNGCPAHQDENSEAYYIPHETDCDKFYECSNGVKHIFDCPPGMDFNPKLNVCDWPWRAGCTNSYTTENPEAPTAIATDPPTDSGVTQDPNVPICPTPDPMNTSTFFPKDGDCTKYWQCSNGEAILMPCPVGLHFNPMLNVCDWPWRAGCVDSTETPTDEITTKGPIPTNAPASSTSTVQSGPPKPSCPTTDPTDTSIYFPVDGDCTHFWQCSNGEAILMPCPDGLHFNPTLNVCDWPWRAGCVDSTEAPTDEITTKGPIPTNAPASSTSTVQPGPPKPSCPTPDPTDTSIYFPVDGDCTYFWQCSNGEAILMPCPDGLHFNPTLDVCDWPWSAGCVDSTKPPVSPTTTTEAPTDEITTEGPIPTNAPASSTPTVQPGPSKPSCPTPDPTDTSIYFPVDGDCTHFWQCSNGQAILMPCPDGLHFNPTLNVCDWPADVGCKDNTKPPVSPTTATDAPTAPGSSSTITPSSPTPTVQPGPPKPSCPTPDPTDTSIYFPVDGDCTHFWQCSNGQAILMPCPDGLHFNPTLNVCDWPADAGCKDNTNPPVSPTTATDAPTAPGSNSTITSVSPTPTDPPGPVPPYCPGPESLLKRIWLFLTSSNNTSIYYPVEGDCSKFWQCSNGEAVLMSCPDGLHFNPTLDVCDFPSHAGCQNNTTPTVTIPSPEPTKPVSPTPTDQPGSSKPTCPTPDPTDTSIYFPVDGDCTHFWQCSNGEAILMPCPDGLHFNPTLNVCDWPADAGCKDNTNPPVSPTTTTDTPTEPGSISTITPVSPTPTDPPYCPGPERFPRRIWMYLTSSNNSSIYYPVEGDCSKFWQCSNGEAVLMTCPDGLHFNPTLNVCDFPSLAGCQNNTTPTVTAPSPEPTKPVSPTPIDPPSSSKPTCPTLDPTNTSIYFPVNGDCTHFWQCSNGEAILMPCPDGLHFNPTLNVCDWPVNAGCDNTKPTTTTPNSEVTTTTPSSEITTTTPNSGITTTTPSSEITTTTPNSGVTTTTPSSEITTTTPNSGVTTTTPSSEITTTTPNSGVTTTPSSEIITTTPNSGVTTTTPSSGITTTTLSTLTTPKEPSICPPSECQDTTMYLPDESDPTRYIRCDHGKSIVETCPRGGTFDPDYSICIIESEAQYAYL